MNSKEIREKQFKKSAMFGYKTADVDAYIQDLADSVEELENKNADLREKLEILAKKVRQYRAAEEQLKNAMLETQKHCDTLIGEATDKSDKMIASAKVESDKMIDDAKLKSISMISDARTEYDKIVEATQAEQRGSKIALANLQKEVSDFKAGLIELYKQHLSAVIAMPEMVDAISSEATETSNDNQLKLDEDTSED